MHKTLHKKLTEKHNTRPAPAIAFPDGEEGLTGLVYEMSLLREAAKDLLQPRPQAVAKLLQMAKAV